MLGDSQESDSYLPSQPASINLLGCRWGWCRCTFLDQAELVNHVIHEHARTAVPIRRRDIATVRRIEEGELSKGDSQQQFATTPSFASLASPAQTPISSSIPPSPSFNSLVSRSAARIQPAVAFKDKTPAYVSDQSQSVPSSFASQSSVVMKLTRSPSLEQVDSDGEASGVDSEMSGSSSSNTSTAAESGSDSDAGPSKSQHGFLLHRHGGKKSAHPQISHHAHHESRTTLSPRPVVPPSPSKFSRSPEVHGTEGAEQDSQFSSSISQSPTKLETQDASRKVRTLPKKKRVFRSGTLQIAHIPLAPEPYPEKQMENLVHSQIDNLSQAMEDRSEMHDSLDYEHSQSFEENSYPPLQTQAPYDSQIVSQI